MLVSQVQRRLAERLGGELNHRVGRRCIDVALERAGVRIAVEFDSWYFHGHPDRQAQDEARERGLARLGWRVLRIRSAYRLPAPRDLDAAIERLIAGEKRVEITLPEWGVGPHAGAEFDPERKTRPYHRREGGGDA
jgi:very-short-patch-repair endonuclease